jgi:DNA-binding MarR family transcriptional regulator
MSCGGAIASLESERCQQPFCKGRDIGKRHAVFGAIFRRPMGDEMNKTRPPVQTVTTETVRKRPRPLDLPGENDEIAALLRQAAGALRLAEERLLADLGVTPPQLAALGQIGAHPGILAADLARRARLTPQTVSLIVANLRRAGLAREEPGVAAALSRARPLALTPQGESVLRIGRERVEAAGARLIEGMRPKRERALRRWLAGVANGLALPGAFDPEDL